MGRHLRALTRRKLFAIAAGVLLSGALLVAFESWLGGLIDRQGHAEVAMAARRAVALADSRLNQAVATLDALAARGVGSCQPGDIEAMRDAAVAAAAAAVKTIALLGPDGQTLCSTLDLPRMQARPGSSTTRPSATRITFDVVKLADAQTMIRLRRKASTGADEIAAYVPVVLLLPQVSIKGSPLSAYVRLTTRAGGFIGAAGHRPKPGDTRFSVQAASDKFDFDAEILVPRGMVPAEHNNLRWLGLLGTAAVVVVLGVFVVLLRRRAPGNPVAEIERALAAGEFVPYYQPIVDIRSGQLRGAEVLVRWRKADGTLVLPGAFIPLVESSGLIHELTRDLMKRVCVEAGVAIGCRPALKISFNFAGKLFSDESIVKDVRKIFSNSPIKLSQVVLEVTERDPIENFTEARQIIAALQGLGVRIAIDDVGTGHSGLSYMLKLGVDIIKIDKMFVDAIGTDRNSTTIVETLVDLAHNMRMDVVAEGVETFEQVVHLRELGIRSAQGYVFAPPLPGSSFLQLVEAIDPLPGALAPAVEANAVEATAALALAASAA
ncbi:MAG: EAL domain-containing protein [Stellaceae bacterium]